MASIIASARTSTASVFDTVNAAATTITGIIHTGAIAVDMLSLKTQSLHKSIKLDTAIYDATYEAYGISKAATDYADRMEELHRRNNPGTPFDRQTCITEITAKITESINTTSKGE